MCTIRRCSATQHLDNANPFERFYALLCATLPVRALTESSRKIVLCALNMHAASILTCIFCLSNLECGFLLQLSQFPWQAYIILLIGLVHVMHVIKDFFSFFGVTLQELPIASVEEPVTPLEDEEKRQKALSVVEVDEENAEETEIEESEINRFQQCVCCEKSRSEKLLSCLHPVCARCLPGIQENEERFRCPICKEAMTEVSSIRDYTLLQLHVHQLMNGQRKITLHYITYDLYEYQYFFSILRKFITIQIIIRLMLSWALHVKCNV